VYLAFGPLMDDPETHPFAAQDRLLPPGELEREDGMIGFAWENQGNWSCRCPAGPGDPPVLSDAADLWTGEEEGFVEVCESLDHFLGTLLLQEAVMGCANLYAMAGDPDAVAGLEPLWLNGKYVFEEPTHDFYGVAGSDLLLMRHAHEGLVLASPTVSDPDEVERITGLAACRLN
jgi:hypothetical protein